MILEKNKEPTSVSFIFLEAPTKTRQRNLILIGVEKRTILKIQKHKNKVKTL